MGASHEAWIVRIFYPPQDSAPRGGTIPPLLGDSAMARLIDCETNLFP